MNTVSCHQCGQGFEALRSDARFCSPRCRKQHSRKNTTSKSHSKQTEIIERFDLSNVLLEGYRKTLPDERPLYLERLIDRAIAGETKIKQVLSNPYLLSRAAEDNPNLHQPTISKLAHRFTRDTLGVSIHDAVDTPPGGTIYSTLDLPEAA